MRRRLRVGGLAVVIAVAVTVAPTFEAAFAKAPPLTGPPNTPGAVALITGNRSITAAWSESSNGSFTYTATATASGRNPRSCTTKFLLCKISALVNGVVYDVAVVAKDKSGTSNLSTAASARAGVPGAPRFVRASQGVATISVSWLVPVASGVSKITTYMATASPGGESCSTTGTILSQPGRSCTIAGLTAGTTYSVTVTATNSYGTGAPSSPSPSVPCQDDDCNDQ